MTLPRPLRLFAAAAYLALTVTYGTLAVQAATVGLGAGWALFFATFAAVCAVGACWLLTEPPEPTRETHEGAQEAGDHARPPRRRSDGAAHR